MLTAFSSKSEKAINGRPIQASELKNMLSTFIDRCKNAQLNVPSKFEAEMNRRIKEAEKSSTKAKLTFSNVGLEDQHLIFLVEALASSPVLIKLNIADNNLTDKGVSYIGRLLKGQIKLVKTVPIDRRLSANFLGFVEVGNAMNISDKVLDDIQKYTRILSYCIAQTAIRRLYVDHKSPSNISPELFKLLWKEMIGNSPNRQLLQDTISLYASNETYLTYPECEVALLQELQDNGTIPVLAIEEYYLFKTDEEIEELTPFRLRKEGDNHGSEIDEEENEDMNNTKEITTIQSNNMVEEPQLSRSPSVDSTTSSEQRYFETHPHSNLFSMIDRNSDGKLTLTEFIQALRTQPAVSKALSLPRLIKQEDGTRDACVRAFNDMDVDNSGTIDRRKFLSYLDTLNTISNQSPRDTNQSQSVPKIEDKSDEMKQIGSSEMNTAPSEIQEKPGSQSSSPSVSPSISPSASASEDDEEEEKEKEEVKEEVKKETEKNIEEEEEEEEEETFSQSEDDNPSEEDHSESVVNDNQNDNNDDDDYDDSQTAPVSQNSQVVSQQRDEKNDDDEMKSHPHSNLFSMIDRNSDGKLTLTEFIQALRTQPAVSKALSLPRLIKQEDGTRDACVRAFNDMDVDNSGVINRHKFLSYLDKLNQAKVEAAPVVASGSDNEDDDDEENSDDHDDDHASSTSNSNDSEDDDEEDDGDEEEKGDSQPKKIPSVEQIKENQHTLTIKQHSQQSIISNNEDQDTPPLNLLLIMKLQQSKAESVSLAEYVGHVKQLRPKDENAKDRFSRLFQRLNSSDGGKGSVNRETIINYLKRNELPEDSASPSSSSSQSTPHSTPSHIQIKEKSPSFSSASARSSSGSGFGSSQVVKNQPVKKNEMVEKTATRRVIGQRDPRLLKSSPSPSSNSQPQSNEKKITSSRNNPNDSIISPYVSFSQSKGRSSPSAPPLPPLPLSSSFSFSYSDDVSYFPIRDDIPNESNENSSSPSYSNGVLIVSSQELSSLEVPHDMISLVYQQPSHKSFQQKKSAVQGIHLVHTIVFSHNLITDLKLDKLEQFTSLQKLDLSFNQIQQIPHPISNNLLILNLNYNSIKKLSGLLLCQSLVELCVSHNEIKIIDGLPSSLKRLDLSFNLIDGDLNLRMLGLCPHITSINIDQNPVIFHLKNWRARLFSLLPKLEEINNEPIPKVRKGGVFLDSPTHQQRHGLGHRPGSGHGHGQGQGYQSEQSVNVKDISMRSTVASRSREFKPHSISPHKQKISKPKKWTRSEQQAHDESRYREYESLRKSREKLEKEMNNLLKSMSRTVHKKAYPAQELIEISLKMNKWRPGYVKKIEDNEKKRKEELEKIKLEQKQQPSPVKKSPIKKKIKQRSVHNQETMSEREIRYGHEIHEWMRFIQTRLSTAYEIICHIFHEIQLILKDLYQQKNIMNTSTSTVMSNLTTATDLPMIQIPFEKYVQEIDYLMPDIVPLHISYDLIPRSLIEDCLGWNEDVGYCANVLKLLKEIFILTTQQHDGIQLLGDCLSDIVTSLQIGENGQQLEFVAWKAGSVVCNVISSRFSSSRYSMNLSSFSPITKAEITLPDQAISHSDEVDSIKNSVSVFGPPNSPSLKPTTDTPTSPHKHTTIDIDARMENAKVRALQRVGIDPTSPKLKEGVQNFPSKTANEESAFQELKRNPSKKESPSPSSASSPIPTDNLNQKDSSNTPPPPPVLPPLPLPPPPPSQSSQVSQEETTAEELKEKRESPPTVIPSQPTSQPTLPNENQPVKQDLKPLQEAEKPKKEISQTKIPQRLTSSSATGSKSMMSTLEELSDDQTLSPVKELPNKQKLLRNQSSSQVISNTSTTTNTPVPTPATSSATSKRNEFAKSQSLMSFGSRQNSTQEEVEREKLTASDVFSRMGSLQEKIMRTSSRNVSHEGGESEYRNRSTSNVSSKSGTSSLAESNSDVQQQQQKQQSQPPSTSSKTSSKTSIISKFAHSEDENDEEEETGNDSKSISSTSTSLSALERLKLKLHQSKLAKSEGK